MNGILSCSTSRGSDESVRRSFQLLNSQKTQGDDLDCLLGMVDDDLLKSAIQSVEERNAKIKAEQIAYSILEIRDAKDAEVAELVKQIRELREDEKRLLKRVEYINAGMAYGISKSDFSPLQKVLIYHGIADFSVFDQEWLKGWRQAQKEKKDK